MNMKAKGQVVFVGAGPGDPGLLTLKGKHMLEQADVVLYDHLAHPTLLNWATRAELICVGKQKGNHSVTQEKINQLLVKKANEGKFVVRLKGGDPGVFGRLGEEMQLLQKENINYLVVPGISAAMAVPLYAGIPLTHRDLSRSVAFVTATVKKGKKVESIDIPEADTLVFFMVVTHLEALMKRLMKFKKFNENTPAAIIYKGTTAQQKVVLATLNTLYDKMKVAQIKPPALLVVGNVASFTTELSWTKNLPLFGQRLFVLRTLKQSTTMADELQALGAEVISWPMIEIRPLVTWKKHCSKESLMAMDIVIFTSPNAVQEFFKGLFDIGLDCRCLANSSIVAMGPKTSQTLKEWGINSNITPKTFQSEGVLSVLPTKLKGKRVLIPSAKTHRNVLAPELENRGAIVEQWAIYETINSQAGEQNVADSDAVIFTSATVADHYFSRPETKGIDIQAFCLGPITEEAVRKYFKGKIVTAPEATWPSLKTQLIHHFSKGN